MQWPWMTLNGVIALILRYFTELDTFGPWRLIRLVEGRLLVADRPIMTVEYRIPLLAKTDPPCSGFFLQYIWATCRIAQRLLFCSPCISGVKLVRWMLPDWKIICTGWEYKNVLLDVMATNGKPWETVGFSRYFVIPYGVIIPVIIP